MGAGLGAVAILIALMTNVTNATGDRAPRKADGVTALATSMEVVVAQIDADGRTAIACVDGHESARQILERPIPSAEPKEQ